MDPIGGISPYYQQNQVQNQNQGSSAAAAASGGGASASASAGPGGASAAAAASGGASASASAGPGGATATASAGGARGQYQTRMDPESRLQAAGDQFGQALSRLSPEEKADMRKLKEMVDQWADQMEKDGQPVDRASMFALAATMYAKEGMEQNPGNRGLAGLFGAGSNFVDATHNVVQQDKQQMGCVGGG